MNQQTNRLYSQEEVLTQLVQNGSNIYGYLIRERRGIFPDSVARQYGIPSAIDRMPDWMVEHGRVAPGSVGDWLSLFSAADRGDNNGSAMVSLKSENGDFGRYWLRFDTVRDEQGQPFFALVSFDDFTSIAHQFRAKDNDINGLLQAARRTFPEILTINLTRGTYRMLQYDSATTLGTPQEGSVDDMVRIRLGGVVPEDRESFASTFSHDNLTDTFLRDKTEWLQLVYRRPGKDGKVYWFETTVMQQGNSINDDVLLVAMSRSVDAQKAEEARLREQLRQQAEELRLTMSQMGKVISYYDVLTSTFTMPPSEAEKHGVPTVMTGFPESFIARAPESFPAASLKTIQGLYDAIRRGDPKGSCEYLVSGVSGKELWIHLEFAAIFDNEHRPIRAVVSAENVTIGHAQAAENRRLRENERILELIAQHSDRVVTYYDLDTRTVRFHNDDSLNQQPIAEIFEQGFIPPESAEKVDRIFRDIYSGVPSGEEKVLFKNEQDELRWIDLKYSTLFSNEKKPVTALFSFTDITEQYEHELAYRRYIQSVEFDEEEHLLVIESDLTANRVERLGGRMLPHEERQTDCSHSDFGRQMLDAKFLYENREEASKYFSIENLLQLYTQGQRHLISEWHVLFHDGTLHWLNTEIVLMADPYTDHVKAFFRMVDITEEKEAQLKIQHRSERDGMTGLLNRATVEERIREKITQKEHPGILILLDLDDLKTINDTFGHKEGDRAILGIAETLKQHFRESDIIGRIGGDEFVIYLPGAAENSDAIAVTITAMLRKLAGISVGGNDERRIHCSVGCTVQNADADTFEALYKRADMALYHVKRNGKNNFAFYSPDMEQEDYQFQSQKLFSLQSTKKFELAELQYLLSAIASFYQLVLSVNLSANDYYLMEETRDGVFSHMPAFGVLENFIELATDSVHPSDTADFVGLLSRKALLEAYERGETSVRHYFRFLTQGEYRWTEAIVLFYTNERGDVCDFTLLRWANERAYELDRLWLQKVLELAVASGFEYICLINTDTRDYFLYGNEQNTHNIPKRGSFDEATREIRDHLIPPQERDVYYENANLDGIEARMKSGDGSYSYRYTMPDGEREASFYWFEPTHTQLLMTVQRCR